MHDPVVQQRWLHAISEMASLPHADHAQLADIRRFIVEGVSLQLRDGVDPPPLVYSNSPSVLLHADAVRARLREYMEFGAVVQLPDNHPADRIQPLLVVLKPGRKPRLCIDLSRNLNDFLILPRFSYARVGDAVRRSFPGCWYAKLDLSNCFLSFPLHPDAVQHFVFRFEGKLYAFTGMPFGLASAPFICTMILSVVAHQLHQAGIVLVRYLDDFLIIAASESVCAQQLIIAQSIFAQFGLVVNPDKTEGPLQCITFLGVEIDSVHRTLRVTEERMQELLQLLEQCSAADHMTGHMLASLVGKLSFAAACLPGARPFMRHLLDAIPHGHGSLDGSECT